jgi:4-aminobutyrate aminotransferase-like enzyme
MLPDIQTPIPGPRSIALAQRLRRFESRNVTFTSPEWPIFWQRANGVNVWDADGNRYIDLTSAFGVASLGHGANSESMIAQAETLIHAMGDVHPTEVKAALCEQLSSVTFERWGAGEGKVILGNSGSDAVEAALKTALLATGKPGIIAFRGGYHGLGFGALAAGGLPFFQDPFRPQLADLATLIDYPQTALELDAARRAIIEAVTSRSIAAILFEPIQGRGGCIVPAPSFLSMVRALCDEHGLLLIADEILTGFNRTGTMFACEHDGVVPDIICLGKALTGGFPLSACVGRAALIDAWPESHGEALHTSTYLGHPVGCAMALASIKAHSHPEVATQVIAKGERFSASLRALNAGAIRGRGLMLGLELLMPDGTPDGRRAIHIVQSALRAGIVMLADSPSANILSFTPPFAIEDDEIEFVVAWLASALGRA